MGINIYEYEFPKDLGYLEIRNDRYDAIVLRYDLDNETKTKCISKFLGIKPFPMVQKNISVHKPYRKVYQNFIQAVRFPENYVNTMLDSRYTRHFFSQSEIQSLRHRWLTIK